MSAPLRLVFLGSDALAIPTLDAIVDGSQATDPFVAAAAAELVRWREAALASWRQRGALVVDCAPDKLSARLLDAYLEVKARRLL